MRNSMNKVNFWGRLVLGIKIRVKDRFLTDDLPKIDTPVVIALSAPCEFHILFIPISKQSAVRNESFTPQKWNLNFVEKLLIAFDAFGPWWMWKCDNNECHLRREKISRRQLKLHCQIMLIGLRVVYANDICVNVHKTPENGNGTWAEPIGAHCAGNKVRKSMNKSAKGNKSSRRGAITTTKRN